MEFNLAEYSHLLISILGFGVVALSATSIAVVFQKIHLPIITGFLFTGILCGPYLLNMIPKESAYQLNFINDIAIAFIAFAAGSELYFTEIRARFNVIKWNTICQLVITFSFGFVSVLYFSDLIPFVHNANEDTRIAIALLVGAIFVTLSPASTMAIISELRAKGPLTQTVIGVTLLTDFVVIILFATCMSFAYSLTSGERFNFINIFLLLVEILVSLGIGLGVGKLLDFIVRRRLSLYFKSFLIVGTGYLVYLLKDYIKYASEAYFSFDFTIEPLIICIIASLYVANYTKSRPEFLNILAKTFPIIYAAFFTLTGASISLYALWNSAAVALLFAFIRGSAIFTATFFGGVLAKDRWPSLNVRWMPYITQAGVSLGLTAMVFNEFHSFGEEFAAFIIGIIIVNELVGPPLFKYALTKAGENHNKGVSSTEGVRKAIIFGFENQSVSLTKQLKDNGWQVQIATRKKEGSIEIPSGMNIKHISGINLETLKSLDAENSTAIVCLMSDQRNLETCELAYKHFGTRDLIVRLGERSYFEKFLKLGVRVVDPSTAIVSLLDHFVRSPQATSLLLGMEPGQDTRDMVLLDPNLHGMALRDLRLPSEVLILSIHRGGQMIISHGFTRLRLNDVVTFVGSKESLDDMSVKFESL